MTDDRISDDELDECVDVIENAMDYLFNKDKKRDDVMTGKRSKKVEKLKGVSDPPSIKEVKPEDQVGTFKVENDSPFVSDDVKLEQVKKQVRQDRIVKDRIILDFWLRHELQLGTGQIKKLWKKMDEVYR